MQPAGATVLSMVLTSALELDLLEIISKNVALPRGQLSPRIFLIAAWSVCTDLDQYAKYLTKNKDGVALDALLFLECPTTPSTHTSWESSMFPHVIAEAVSYPGIEHIGGDMSLNIPKADDIFMKVSKERTEKEYGTLARGSGFQGFQGFQVVCRAYGTHIMEFLKKI
ncbi:hypothetical protein F2Q69_00034243 [Brassica cretica]|uniref:Uncharacterized protein n=1 Tax=Brassica cretica TaxID=69181 RepID=A0A8S9SEW3_BRACR|nr:hypothetical protein F2Q69_00034243 [Brassica cretica]